MFITGTITRKQGAIVNWYRCDDDEEPVLLATQTDLPADIQFHGEFDEGEEELTFDLGGGIFGVIAKSDAVIS